MTFHVFVVTTFHLLPEVLGFFGGIAWALLVARVCWGHSIHGNWLLEVTYPLVNDHIAIGGISPVSIGNTNFKC